ncbi:response regulator transcription factor [Shinella sedimenti]|uniref:Response regulator transcription factor n=2 Tax=Shinella TaxID=323620 RepID=A0ABT0CQ55_9HYPH|nr:response regulator transcription factor [Shinella sedimenti]MCJ8150741.1 response regulator transcription factor [Shinella sedimenti]
MSMTSTLSSMRERPIRAIFLEDDQVLRKSLADFLSLNSISVVDVASVASFRKAIVDGDFDVALIDLGLPDGSGLDVARELRGTGIGLIIITARSGRADRLQGYQDGADLFFIKPVDGAELVLAIRNLARRLRRAEVVAKGEMTSNAIWTFDRAGQRLMAPTGVSIKLSGREAAFVDRLAQAGGETASREELALALGYREIDIESRRVDAVLRRLRQKARAVDTELPVHAVHALGFRFSAKLSTIK